MPGNSRRLVLLLGLFATAIMGVHLVTLIADYGFGRDHVFGLRDLFDVDRERNVPAAFSFILLLAASALLGLITYRHAPGAKPRAAYWAGLSLAFLCLAADEALEIHESVGAVVARVTDAGELTYYAWLLPYSVIALGFGIAYLRFLRQLPRITRARFLIAATIFAAGALGTEALAAVYVHFQHTEHTLAYDLLSALEEALEMTGLIYFIHVLSGWLQNNSAPMPKHRGAVSPDSRTSTSA
jgi:uncharacterized membrane protein YidH (DUF202 family)